MILKQMKNLTIKILGISETHGSKYPEDTYELNGHAFYTLNN